ncbi:hypothetical protein C8039_08915 [Halogeometricum sp. wsp3]|nr:hypothetical protein C8039_08915 [Halogeometricum sp. wsp3]
MLYSMTIYMPSPFENPAIRYGIPLVNASVVAAVGSSGEERYGSHVCTVSPHNHRCRRGQLWAGAGKRLVRGRSAPALVLTRCAALRLSAFNTLRLAK